MYFQQHPQRKPLLPRRFSHPEPLSVQLRLQLWCGFSQSLHAQVSSPPNILYKMATPCVVMLSSFCQMSAGSVNHHYFIHHFLHQKKTTKNQHHRHHHQSLTAVYWSFVILAYLLVLKINIFLSSSLNLPLVRFGCLKPHHDPS